MVIIFYFNVTHLIYDQRNHVSLWKSVNQAPLLCCFIKFHIFTQRRSTFFPFILAVGIRRRAPWGGETRLITAAFNLHPIAALGRSLLSAVRPAALKEQREVKKSLTSDTCCPQPFLMLHEHFPYRNSERWAGVSRLPAIQLDLVSHRPSLDAQG